MKNKLIQLLGIQGAGKTHLMQKIEIGGINYIDFGREFKEWLRKVHPSSGALIVPDAPNYGKEFLEHIIRERQPAIFTSHIVHYDGKTFSYDHDAELYANCAGYLFVFSKPEDIMTRRLMDNASGSKPREVFTLGEISRHQEVSLEKARFAADSVGSPFAMINNFLGNEQHCLDEIRAFVRGVLL